MRGEAVIDLGELSEADTEAEVEIERPKWRPPTAVLAPLIVLCVLAIVAAPAPRSRVVRIAEFPGIERGFMLVAGGLLRQDGGEMFFVGADGRERWRIPWRATDEDFPQASSAGGRVLMRTIDRGDGMRTVALDLATGERKWELPGWVHSLGDLLLLAEEGLLRIYEADAGRLLWESAGHRAVGFDVPNGSVFVLDHDQLLSEHDMRTGRMLNARQLSIPAELVQAHIEVLADHVLLATTASNGRREEVAYYDRRTLQPVDAPAPRWYDRWDCGAAVECVVEYGPSTGGGVVERATGRLLWSVPVNQFVAPWDGGSVIILRHTDWPGEYRVIDVVDPLTRRSMVNIVGATLLSDIEALDPGPVPVTRIALIRANGRPTLVAHVGATGIRVLGSVPQSVNNCRYIAPLVQCRVDRNTIGVWRIDD